MVQAARVVLMVLLGLSVLQVQLDREDQLAVQVVLEIL